MAWEADSLALGRRLRVLVIMPRRYRTYGRRRSSRRTGAQWAAYHLGQRDRISHELGGVDQDVLNVFFNLDDRPLAALIALYRRRYGDSAASYARATIPKWKAGTVRCSGQTVERLIATLPEVIDFTTKCDLLQRMRERTRTVDRVQLTVSPSNWRARLTPHLESAISRPYTAQLPVAVERRLTWLASEDGQLASRLLAEIEAAESATTIAFVERELGVLGKMLSELDGRAVVKHVITLPYAQITLQVKGQRKMDSSDRPTRGDQSLFAPNSRDVIDSALVGLDESQRKRLAEKAADVALQISAEEKRAEIRSRTAERDISNFVSTADRTRAAARGSEYSLTTTIETASGTTTIHVRRSPWFIPAIVLGAVALAIVLFLVLRL